MIKVINNYYIRVTNNSYDVVEVHVSETGKAYERPISYHIDVGSALNSILREVQRDAVINKDLTFIELLEEFKRIRDDFRSIVDTVKNLEAIKCRK